MAPIVFVGGFCEWDPICYPIPPASGGIRKLKKRTHLREEFIGAFVPEVTTLIEHHIFDFSRGQRGHNCLRQWHTERIIFATQDQARMIQLSHFARQIISLDRGPGPLICGGTELGWAAFAIWRE